MHSPERSLNESAGGFAAIGLLPLIDLILILGLRIDPGSNAAFVALPLAFAAAAWAINRLLSVPGAWAALHAAGCVAACFGVAVTVGVVEELFFTW
jgi:hypothetical protein